jgi:very-short-patch-repair endonuclease
MLLNEGIKRPDMVGNKWRAGKHPWNYGKRGVYAKETLDKMALAKLGGKHTEEHNLKIGESSKGRKHSDASKRKMAVSKIGDLNPSKRSDVRAKLSLAASRADVIESKARKMPYSNTKIELLMQAELTRRGIPFKSSHQLFEKYNVDIFIEPNIVIECDGEYWHSLERMKLKDKRRDGALKTLGFRIYRFWGKDIEASVKACVDYVMADVDNGSSTMGEVIH